MPITDNLYVDDVSVKAVIAKTKAQANQAQQVTQSTINTEDELPGWGQHYLNDPAVIAMRRRYGSEAYVKDLKARSEKEKANTLVSRIESVASRIVPSTLRAFWRSTEHWEVEMAKKEDPIVLATRHAVDTILPGEDKVLKEANKEKWSDIKSTGGKIGAVVGDIVGNVEKIGIGMGYGAALGAILPSSVRAAGVAEKLTTTKVGKAISGTLKGMIIGSEVAKGVAMKLQGYSWGEAGLTIAGDIGGLWGFGRGFAETYSAKLAKDIAIKKTHEVASRHKIIIDESDNFLIGKQYTATSEKPLVIEKGIRVKAGIDKQRSVVGAVEYMHGERWLGERPVVLKKFMSTGEKVLYGERFPLVGITEEQIFSGGLARQTVLLDVSRTGRIDTGFLALRNAMKASTVVAQKIAPEIAVGVGENIAAIGLSGTNVISALKHKIQAQKTTTIEFNEDELIKRARGQRLLQVQMQSEKQEIKFKPSPVMTYGQELAEQIKQELTPQQKQGLQEEQEQGIVWTPKPKPQPEPQIQEEVTIPIQTPKPLTREQETPIEIPKEVPVAVPILTGAIIPKTNIPKVIVLLRLPRRSTSARVSRVFGSALWKKSGRKNKNKIFSLNLPKPKNPFILPRGGRKNGIF